MTNGMRYLTVIAAGVLFSAAIARPAAAVEKAPDSGGPQCSNQQAATCHSNCYAAYESFILGNPKPGQVEKHKKELAQCYKGCKAERCGAGGK